MKKLSINGKAFYFAPQRCGQCGFLVENSGVHQRIFNGRTKGYVCTLFRNEYTRTKEDEPMACCKHMWAFILGRDDMLEQGELTISVNPYNQYHIHAFGNVSESKLKNRYKGEAIFSPKERGF